MKLKEIYQVVTEKELPSEKVVEFTNEGIWLPVVNLTDNLVYLVHITDKELNPPFTWKKIIRKYL